MTEKRFIMKFVDYDDEWKVYDSDKGICYDVDLSEYQKEMERLQRNHNNLHEKYEELNNQYKKCKSEITRLKGNTSSARQIYMNLKGCFE